MVEQPAQFQPGKIGRERQAGARVQAVGAAVLREMRHEVVGARIHPHDRVVERLAGRPVPQKGRLALVGDTDGREIGGLQPGLLQRRFDDVKRVAPDFERVVLDPACAGIDLLMLALVHGDDIALRVEDDET